eukprot:CAMPEP_0119375450 /NCGR_PEP_ID=MMETSP1334-20130426/36008_1 /TAXON_ID=127549 /ORGANISM="Calcidiscus leptoporus, Strain RCC1130" /LENGTH=141 /DNA_ID=CAMNT_0007393771 /DNA_START=9 /DNA_END=434 /DNA_ORIENTATION=-
MGLKDMCLLLFGLIAHTHGLQISTTPAVVRTRSPCMNVAQERIKEMVAQHKVMLFMKGNKMFPQCGFSNTAVQILNACETPFETFDVLSDNEIREGVKTFSKWPTIPQCYVDGEFIGGCDVMIEMYQNGELQEMVEKANAS